jgi:hypothetical protein
MNTSAEATPLTDSHVATSSAAAREGAAALFAEDGG